MSLEQDSMKSLILNLTLLRAVEMIEHTFSGKKFQLRNEKKSFIFKDII